MAVITPNTFDALHRYVSVRLQQGVPIVDADWNEKDDVRRFEVRAFLKWFVGNGVPFGNNGFSIVGTGAANDFTISAGIAGAPDSLNNVGRILVDGMDAMITANVQYGAQTLPPGPGLLPIPPLTTPVADGTMTVFVDLWEHVVTDSPTDPLVLPGLGTESCARIKREWVVRVRANPGTTFTIPVSGDADFIAGHIYCPLALLTRRNGDAQINVADVTDLRERHLLLPPATLIEDLFGIAATDYRRGLGRPVVTLRSAINALLRGELPGTADTAIAPDLSINQMSYSFHFDAAGGAVAFWHSNRTAATNQVFASRWDPNNPAAGFATPPQQVTSGVAHDLPHAVLLPTGDFVVAYETNVSTVNFRHAPLAGLNAATETAIPNSAATDRQPFAVISGQQIVFFWQRQTGLTWGWMYRRRQYPANWSEAGATWLDATDQSLAPAVNSQPPGPSRGQFHAAVDNVGDVWAAFATSASHIQAVRLTPGTGASTVFPAFSVATDQMPFVLIEGTTAVWVFWSHDGGISSQRFTKATASWDAAPTAVPDTNVGPAGTNTRPVVVRDADGAFWLFWVSQRGGASNDIWFSRRNPATSLWGDGRLIAGTPADDDQPFAVIAPNRVVWLFWRSNRTGNYDIYFKQIITVI
jgi:hypothetical protein